MGHKTETEKAMSQKQGEDIEARKIGEQFIKAKRARQPTLSDSYLINMQRGWRRFTRWCNERQVRGAEILNIDQDTMARYIQTRLANVSKGPAVFSHERTMITGTFTHHGRPDPLDRIDQFTQILKGNGREDFVKREARSALNTILYGPPGTGKTYATFRRCVEIGDGKENCPVENDKIRIRYKELVKEGRIEFVTFHQSYGYEEFVEGLRPDTGSAREGGEAGAGFRLVATPGVLKRIAERARGTSGPTDQAEASANAKPHVLVIDEINRANVSKVMGELITLLEEDKREGAENEVAVTLPHSGDRFTLPANLYILGTMNTADRSIALLDTALRRRFEFEELTPKPELLGTVDGIGLPAVLRAINQRLGYLIDRDHLIGHAWLMGARTKADVDRIMHHKIIPLIAEYFYDDWQKVQAVLGGTGDFVQGESLVRPPGLGDDTDAGEDRRRWTVQKQFADGAYGRLISGPARDSEQAQNSG